MEICYAITADMAIRSIDGKVSIIGIFSRLYALTFPTTHNGMTVVIGFDAGPGHAGQPIEIQICLLDPDAREVMAAGLRLEVDPNEIRPKGELICEWPPVPLQHPGNYVIRVTSPGAEPYERPLEVFLLQAQ